MRATLGEGLLTFVAFEDLAERCIDVLEQNGGLFDVEQLPKGTVKLLGRHLVEVLDHSLVGLSLNAVRRVTVSSALLLQEKWLDLP